MKTILIIWGVGIVYCIIEAVFFTELDPESKKYLENRKKNRENEHKSTS
jgi:hypothetical protein